jgi:hypothetical protein
MTQAQEILNQLGGNKFIAMTGSKNIFSTDNGMTLSMHLTKNIAKAKYLQITLTENDTYTMIFSKQVGKKYQEEIVEVKKIENVYADMLNTLFESTTGLRTKL